MLKAQNLAQTSSELDSEQFHRSKTFGTESGKAFQVALEKAQSWSKRFNSSSDIPDSLIPESYDLRNIDGFDFTNPLRDQGSCGSCYTVSFT